MASPDRMDPDIAAEIDRLATAFAKDPRSKTFIPLAESYIKAGMWQEAAAVLEDGLKVYPGFVTAMAALGRVYDQLGQSVKAKAILEEVVKQSPDNLRAHRILAKLFAQEGKADVALKSCAAILDVSPYDEEALAIRRSITGIPDEHDRPREKREKKRLKKAAEQDANPKPSGDESGFFPAACFRNDTRFSRLVAGAGCQDPRNRCDYCPPRSLAADHPIQARQ